MAWIWQKPVRVYCRNAIQIHLHENIGVVITHFFSWGIIFNSVWSQYQKQFSGNESAFPPSNFYHFQTIYTINSAFRKVTHKQMGSLTPFHCSPAKSHTFHYFNHSHMSALSKTWIIFPCPLLNSLCSSPSCCKCMMPRRQYSSGHLARTAQGTSPLCFINLQFDSFVAEAPKSPISLWCFEQKMFQRLYYAGAGNGWPDQGLLGHSRYVPKPGGSLPRPPQSLFSAATINSALWSYY